MKLLWAVVRSDRAGEVVAALKRLGVPGCSVSNVKGYGRGWRVYDADVHGDFKKVEILVAEDDRIEELGRVVQEAARTGLKGDGVIAVLDCSHAVKIRHPNWDAEFPRIGEPEAGPAAAAGPSDHAG